MFTFKNSALIFFQLSVLSVCAGDCIPWLVTHIGLKLYFAFQKSFLDFFPENFKE